MIGTVLLLVFGVGVPVTTSLRPAEFRQIEAGSTGAAPSSIEEDSAS